eukprot:TRINITY_DN23318_c1_g1_i2.p1 TRINITY_DN23318_c1_g1~~TRINITY_DN23318_c1_g1_i2.p1  ORF type:complete len:556 (-),score=128.58 TRINITY_DN23318_c1_g1_i2:295-1722(-)
MSASDAKETKQNSSSSRESSSSRSYCHSSTSDSASCVSQTSDSSKLSSSSSSTSSSNTAEAKQIQVQAGTPTTATTETAATATETISTSQASAVLRPANRPTVWSIGGSDEEFAAWVAKALHETAENENRSEGAKPSEGDDEANQNSQEAYTANDLPPNFAGYKFSGPLRPGRVSRQMPPPEGCSTLPDYSQHPKGVSRSEHLRSRTKTIPILEGEELTTMKEACRLGREILDIASRFLRPGVTGDEIDRVVWVACKERRIYPSPLNYYLFPKSVCVSANEVICHGIPDSRRIEEGDIVNLDVSICHEEFHSDLNETFLVGPCDEESHHLVKTAYNALKAATSLIRPGTMYRQLGAVIEEEANKNDCVIATSFCGHGIGRLFHGPPDVPHFKKNKTVGTMKPGHVFTVEPMLNLGKSGKDKIWPDNWTAVTRNGRRSAQFEHTFLITEDGFEILTARPGTNRNSLPDFDSAVFQR